MTRLTHNDYKATLRIEPVEVDYLSLQPGHFRLSTNI